MPQLVSSVHQLLRLLRIPVDRYALTSLTNRSLLLTTSSASVPLVDCRPGMRVVDGYVENSLAGIVYHVHRGLSAHDHIPVRQTYNTPGFH